MAQGFEVRVKTKYTYLGLFKEDVGKGMTNDSSIDVERQLVFREGFGMVFTSSFKLEGNK